MNEILEALLLNKIGGGGGYPEPTGTKQITANGTGIDVKNYATADVNVPNSYAQADEGKVVQSGALVAQTQKAINANGTVDTTANNSVVVNVPTGELKEYTSGAIPKNTFKTWANTFNSGSPLTVALAPTDETVVEVGDEVLVHGTITSTAGTSFKYYVTGEVTSFDSSNKPVITVKGLGQPSPIADGSMITNSNGSFNVKEYAAITVNVQGDGTTYITQNGTHDVGGYRYANVNVQSSAGNLLFAADATFQSTPVEESYGSATLEDSSVLMGHDEGDPIVLYGLDGASGVDHYLVYGRISLLDSWVEFYATKVISVGGGSKGGDIGVLIGTMFDADPDTVQAVEITPGSPSEISDLSIGDPVIVQGECGSSFVLTGTVDDNSGTTLLVVKRHYVYHNGANIYIDKGGTFPDMPYDGSTCVYEVADTSRINEYYSGARVIVTGEYGGVTYAAYGECTNVDAGMNQIYITISLLDDFS